MLTRTYHLRIRLSGLRITVETLDPRPCQLAGMPCGYLWIVLESSTQCTYRLRTMTSEMRHGLVGDITDVWSAGLGGGSLLNDFDAARMGEGRAISWITRVLATGRWTAGNDLKGTAAAMAG